MNQQLKDRVADSLPGVETLRPRVIVRLSVTEFDCSPQEITHILGLTPSKTWLKGESVHPKVKNVHKQNGWSLYSPIDEYEAGLEEQVDALLALVQPGAARFALLPPRSEIELGCIIYTYGERPAIGFSPEQIKRLAQLGASIDVDQYELGETAS